MSPLYQELNRWSVLPFVWGETDCCLVLGDWIARVTGRDPAAHLRGLYETPADCERLTRFLSDPVAALDRCGQTIGGLPRVAAPARGDVGVYLRPGSRWPFGGLWTGTQWASKGRDGVTFTAPGRVRVLAAWGVGYAA
ncbi:hypothetical protein ATO3_02605 [Marinibacterium profundimaris]|uniref:DUF6950 domain-containing protein n=1 Tax=Marinibacterium profundimaris TaxID=1679460 RepID=A0A225NSY5_9RHOB|nr:hypothetical protein ATO3_02605 [Marinibacterium profundimaris]